MATPDYTILGAGVFGLTAAIELSQRGFSVEVLNHGPIPDPAAASADISKIVRMEYGSDSFYMDIVDRCIDSWHEWNRESPELLYYETGFLLLCSESMDDPIQAYEKASYDQLLRQGKSPDRINSFDIASNFPMFNSDMYVDGFYHSRAGWANASAVLKFLARRCEQFGVVIKTGVQIVSSIHDNDRLVELIDHQDGRHAVNELVACCGSFTPGLFGHYSDKLIPTGHPVFHLKTEADISLQPPEFPVFAADISNTGWYGFPVHPQAGVVKVANHGKGIHQTPPHAEHKDGPERRESLDAFLSKGIPALLDAPCTYKRYCYYSDTPDGHFWIDRDDKLENLTVAAGGSGHGFKMAPALGRWIADAATNAQEVPTRFKRRKFSNDVANQEQARPK